MFITLDERLYPIRRVRWLVATLDGTGVARLFGASGSHRKHDFHWVLLVFNINDTMSPRELFNLALRGDSSFMRDQMRPLFYAAEIPELDQFAEKALEAIDKHDSQH